MGRSVSSTPDVMEMMRFASGEQCELNSDVIILYISDRLNSNMDENLNLIL